jgi:methyl-accepting chemotaxis protein
MRKIKNFLIVPEFQLKFIGIVVVFHLFSSAAYLLCIKYFFLYFKSLGKNVGIPIEHVYFSFISNLEVNALRIWLVTLAISTLAIFLIGVYLSHRIAGPIHRFGSDLERMIKEERVFPISFRKGDDFINLANLFNKFLDKFHRRS